MIFPSLSALVPLLALISLASAQQPTLPASQTNSRFSVAPTASASASAGLNASASANASALASSPALPPAASGSLYPNGTYIFANGTVNGTSNATAPLPVPYAIKLDGAYGVAGAVLILTGIPINALGGKNRWSSLFLIPFYTAALVSILIILHFGLPPTTLNPPSATLRGMFVLISFVAGCVGGGVGLFFWNQGKYLIPFVGGWAVAWFVLCLRADGLIRIEVWRWVLLVGCAAGSFVVGLFNSFYNPMVVLSTAWIGATAFMLGVDCFTRLGLKEFYIYNLGFGSIFTDVLAPQDGHFLLSQGMQIELGCLGVIAFLGAAIQFKAYAHLRTKLFQISAEDRRRAALEEEAIAARRLQTHETELEKWEAQHGHRNAGSPRSPMFGDEESTLMGRGDSCKGGSGPVSKSLDRRDSSYDAVNLLPTLDLGAGEGGLRTLGPPASGHQPTGSNATDSTMVKAPSVSDDPELREKEKLLQEILTIRKSIEALRTTSPSPGPMLDFNPALVSTSVSPTNTTFPAGIQNTDFRRQSTHSFSGFDARRASSGTIPLAAPAPIATGPDPSSPKSEWSEYLAKRVVYRPTSPEAPIPTFHREERSESFSGKATPRVGGRPQAGNERRSSMMSMQGIMEGGAASEWGAAQMNRDITHASRRSSTYSIPNVLAPPPHGPNASSSSRPTHPGRTLSQSDLAARHRERIRSIQEPVKEKFEVEAARERWEGEKRREREEMRVREEKRRSMVQGRRGSQVDVEGWRGSVVEGKGGVPMGGGRRGSGYGV